MQRIKRLKITDEKINPKVKDILNLIGLGTVLAGSFLMPGLPLIMKQNIKNMRNKEHNEWKKYNQWRLKYMLKRLYSQKLIDVVETNNGFVVQVTEKGKKKLFMYDLENIELDNSKWDKKWRIIIYDIDEKMREGRKAFHNILKKLKFLQLQKSVYLTPYSCENEIEYVRQIYKIDKNVIILTISGLENEQAYKDYFGLL